MQAVSQLNAGSARGIDMVSAQELKLLPFDIIHHLAIVMSNYEQGYPSWYTHGITSPFGKVESFPRADQTRPITILPQTYRLWGAVVYMQVKQRWATTMPPSITGLLPGRGSTDASYKAQLAIELSKLTSTHRSGLSLDLVKCFNNIAWPFTIRLLRHFGLPERPLQQWARSLVTLQRSWCILGHILPGPGGTNGYPEGDPWSVICMLLLAAFWVFHLQHVHQQHPTWSQHSLESQAYADNWGWQSNSPAIHRFVMQATITAVQFAGVRIDFSKTWCWSTDSRQLTLIQQEVSSVCPVPILVHTSASDLGHQLQYSGNPRLGSILDRLTQGLARLRRIAGASCDLSVKEHLVRASVFPSVFHGVTIRPLAQEHLIKLRSQVANALFGTCHTMSPAIALLFTDNAILDPEYYMYETIIAQARRFLISAEQVQANAFLQIASQFSGTVRNVRGPASTLGYVLQEIGWQITNRGTLHVSPFESFAIHEVSFQRLRRFLQQSWQQDLIMTKTQRESWYRFPDLSRALTLPCLRTLTSPQRCHIIREIAGGYQLASQKAKWTHDDPNCAYCHEPDSRPHRLLSCEVGHQVRTHFSDLTHALQEEDSLFAEIPAMPVPPLHHWFQTLHFRAPQAHLPSNVVEQVQARLQQGIVTHWFTDGSCTHPGSPLTRFAGFSIVMDLCSTDQEREHAAFVLQTQGLRPQTLANVLASRSHGEQDILRAEMLAIEAIMRDSGTGIIHTDSQVAISNFSLALAADHPHRFMHKEHSDILYRVWTHRTRIHNTLTKVRAHQEARHSLPLLEQYFSIGNDAADAAARAACQHIAPSFVQQLQQHHLEVSQMQQQLKEVFQLHLALSQARKQWDLAQTLERQTTSVQPATATVFANWSLDSWTTYAAEVDTSHLSACVWGEDIAHLVIQWCQQLHWPQPDFADTAPVAAGTGWSWTEAALSFMYTTGSFLPVVRKDHLGASRVFWCKSDESARQAKITLKELSVAMPLVLDQVQSLVPEPLTPKLRRRKVSALYHKGAISFTTGCGIRPVFPAQQRVADFVAEHFGIRLPGRQPFSTIPSLHGDSSPDVTLPGTFEDRKKQVLSHQRWARLRRTT
eukprot:Skav225869  [mRNA]  locus=scaffold810:352535:355828:- [translate_table: standard]